MRKRESQERKRECVCEAKMMSTQVCILQNKVKSSNKEKVQSDRILFILFNFETQYNKIKTIN